MPIATIEVKRPLALVDLREDGPVRMGVPTDVVRGSDQRAARRWSVAFHEHESVPDGIIYPSRFSTETNIAVFERALSKLDAIETKPLTDDPALPGILDRFEIAFKTNRR